MFLWIRDQKWLPTLYLSLIVLFIFGGFDFFWQGPKALICALTIAASVLLSRAFPWIAIGLMVLGLLLPTFIGLQPQFSQLGSVITLLVIAGFGNRLQRVVAFAFNASVAIGVYVTYVALLSPNKNLYGIQLPSDAAKVAVGLSGFVALLAIIANAWLIGRNIFTRITHVGNEADLAHLESQLTIAQLNVAEQDKRFGIARDITDLLVEKVSATLVSVESSSYALKADPSAAGRLFESIGKYVKDAFGEIRRLSDLLNIQDSSNLALPGLRDLNKLFVTYRELGFSVNFRENGTPVELVDNAALVIYRIVSETLSNVRQHAPSNTGVDVDFIWTDRALQILIKDNGEETARSISQDKTGYTVDDDQQALTQRPTGIGLSALADMVKLYDATIEFARVPGVGFKVSAAFPDVMKYAKVR